MAIDPLTGLEKTPDPLLPGNTLGGQTPKPVTPPPNGTATNVPQPLLGGGYKPIVNPDYDPTTVRGQMTGLMDPESLLNRQAVAQSKQQAEAMGQQNTSMSNQAGVAAVLSRAESIASKDAPTYAGLQLARDQAGYTKEQTSLEAQIEQARLDKVAGITKSQTALEGDIAAEAAAKASEYNLAFQSAGITEGVAGYLTTAGFDAGIASKFSAQMSRQNMTEAESKIFAQNAADIKLEGVTAGNALILAERVNSLEITREEAIILAKTAAYVETAGVDAGIALNYADKVAANEITVEEAKTIGLTAQGMTFKGADAQIAADAAYAAHTYNLEINEENYADKADFLGLEIAGEIEVGAAQTREMVTILKEKQAITDSLADNQLGRTLIEKGYDRETVLGLTEVEQRNLIEEIDKRGAVVESLTNLQAGLELTRMAEEAGFTVSVGAEMSEIETKSIIKQMDRADFHAQNMTDKDAKIALEAKFYDFDYASKLQGQSNQELLARMDKAQIYTLALSADATVQALVVAGANQEDLEEQATWDTQNSLTVLREQGIIAESLSAADGAQRRLDLYAGLDVQTKLNADDAAWLEKEILSRSSVLQDEMSLDALNTKIQTMVEAGVRDGEISALSAAEIASITAKGAVDSGLITLRGDTDIKVANSAFLNSVGLLEADYQGKESYQNLTFELQQKLNGTDTTNAITIMEAQQLADAKILTQEGENAVALEVARQDTLVAVENIRKVINQAQVDGRITETLASSNANTLTSLYGQYMVNLSTIMAGPDTPASKQSKAYDEALAFKDVLEGAGAMAGINLEVNEDIFNGDYYVEPKADTVDGYSMGGWRNYGDDN